MVIKWDFVFKENPKLSDEKLIEYYRRLSGITGMDPMYIKKMYYKKPRRDKREIDQLMTKHPALAEEVKSVGIPIESISHYWHKGQHFSVFSKLNTKTYFELRDEIVESMLSHSPEYNTIFNYQVVKEPHLLVIDPADVHIGKLCEAIETGDDYNLEVATERIISGVEGLLNKVSPYGVDQILLIIGNDILHTDNPKRTTTSGTPQDTDGMWYNNFLIAKEVYIKIIERLLPLAKLTVHYNPSNHDFTNGFFLADTISSWFSKAPIDFDITPAHRKYFNYGKNLIGSTHGDGAKETDLPLLMANEASEHWHGCNHRYIYTHHMHHKRSKEYQGVTIETVRSISGTDSWHHRNGYQHNVKAMEAFLHHKEHGQIARFTHIFV